MTRDELNHLIKRVEKDIHMSDGLRFQPGLSVSAELLRIKYWFEDVRDNGITEPKKYRIRINDKNLPTPLYLCDVCGDTLFAPENDQFLAYRVTKDKNYAATFTKKFIMNNFKNYLAIDWEKGLEPVEEDK